MPHRKPNRDAPNRRPRRVTIPGWLNALLILFGLLYLVLMLGGFWVMQV